MIDAFQTEYDKLSEEEKEFVYKLFNADVDDNNPLDPSYFSTIKSLIFAKSPPSPQDFLDYHNGWLTKEYTESVFDWVKQDFCELLSGKKHYTHVVEYGATRTGKSTLAILLIFYSMVYVNHLRDMARFYNLAGGTNLSIYILSFKIAKVMELYLKPIYNLLLRSPRCIQVKQQDQVGPRQQKEGLDYLVYSKAAVVGHITLASGLQLVSGNDDALSIIGANILNAFISEIGYFIEDAGTTEDEIFRLYSDMVGRIQGTVGKNYLGFVYLDTSANNRESLIENFIIKDLAEREDVLFRWRKRWDVKELVGKFYHRFKNFNETFPVCVGDGTIPAKIIEDQKELDFYPPNLIYNVPVDLKEEFETNLIKSIKDIVGYPTTSESKFIQSKKLINQIFDLNLDNIEGLIIADSKENPDKFIWNQLVDRFFVKYDGINYILKRCPSEARFIGLDLAHSVKGDVIGITMLHRELYKDTSQVVNVVDFSFAVGPGENGINIEAIQNFIKDLAYLGNVNIVQVNVDRFQSENLFQFLNRSNIKCVKSSVDMDITPYMYLYSCLLSNSLKVGKNVFLRNNLDSLYRVKAKLSGKEKIDHSMGKTENNYFGSWETSTCGINAKDVSDSLVQALFAMNNSNILPMSIWEKQNFRKDQTNKLSLTDETLRASLSDAFKVLHGSALYKSIR